MARSNPVYTAMIIITAFWAVGVWVFILRDPTASVSQHFDSSISPTEMGNTRIATPPSMCPEMAYWKPRTKADLDFVSPFNLKKKTKKYATYEPDYGGFNNIRMTLETLIVFAKATGRTIVLPPRAPIYLLKDTPITNGSASSTTTATKPSPAAAAASAQPSSSSSSKDKKKLLSPTDFFSEGLARLKADQVVEVISFKEFVLRESASSDGLVSQAVMRLHVADGSGVGGGRGSGQGRSGGFGGGQQAESEALHRRQSSSGQDSSSSSSSSEATAALDSDGQKFLISGVVATLLDWNLSAEAGNDDSRKKIRQWIRAATCEPRNDDSNVDSSTSPLEKEKEGSLSGSATAVGAVAAAAAAHKGQQAATARRVMAGAAGDQARCPRWEPLKEAVVFGRAGAAIEQGGGGGGGDGGGGGGGISVVPRKGVSLNKLPANFTANWPINPVLPLQHQHRFSLPDFLTPRRRARFMDGPSAAEPWVHFQTDIKNPARPLFSHWYTLFLFQDYATDVYMKRLIRDYVHYDEVVTCAAGRIIARMDAEAAKAGARKGGGGGGSSGAVGWSSMHVRHGELQYTNVQISPVELLEATEDWLNVTGELLYIATDEPTLSWFSPMNARHETIKFLHDFEEELVGVDSNLFGMVEQVVLAGGRTFTGTWFSTFSAYVCRLRGYYGRFGEDSCFVYAPNKKRFDFAHWKMPSHAFYPREWALAWEGIDFMPTQTPAPRAAAEAAATAEAPLSQFSSSSSLLSPQRIYYEPFNAEPPPVYPDAAVKKKKAAQRAQATTL